MESMRASHVISGIALGCLVAGSGCASSDASTSSQSVSVDRFKELTIVDDAVVLDTRASNAANGPLSFRHSIEAVLPDGADVGADIFEWFQEWVTATDFNGFPVDTQNPLRAQSGRPDQLRHLVTCPWLRATPSNQCDEGCSTCAATHVDMAAAPFRLLGVANRVDLTGHPQTLNPAGELRLVYGLMTGAADDPASAPLPFSLIFEFAVPPEITARDWAGRWHALGQHATYDTAYKDELVTLVNTVTARTSTRMNGSNISQVRSVESALFWVWQAREFRLGPDGKLHHSTVANTPSLTLNNAPQVEAFIKANADLVRNDMHVFPSEMLGGAIAVQESWSFPNLDPELKRVFGQTTCNGCHATENTANFKEPFQMSPMRQGIAKLSIFLHDPAKPDAGELALRERKMSLLLTGGDPLTLAPFAFAPTAPVN